MGYFCILMKLTKSNLGFSYLKKSNSIKKEIFCKALVLIWCLSIFMYFLHALCFFSVWSFWLFLYLFFSPTPCLEIQMFLLHLDKSISLLKYLSGDSDIFMKWQKLFNLLGKNASLLLEKPNFFPLLYRFGYPSLLGYRGA